MSDAQTVYWTSKKLWLGLPWSFTRYTLTNDRIFIRRGLFNIVQDEIMLYRVRDLQVSLKLVDRVFGMGDIKVTSADPNRPLLLVENIKDPEKVKEMIYQAMVIARKENHVSSGEFIQSGTPGCEPGGMMGGY